ncbi:restriction endonuclease subunit S [Desulfocurvibacter africanus]|uniref:Restriction modification system DNA specificity domain-containing protein n=1 Tax=Desulfocurvibacter africanus subsp. africanus str. Walvis Bay TaxID=690850 RepID=F3YXF7_DESAF|nr:restriction endonuclease subunit S [Desulfocurvibacter africanus]EGJ51734.1 restriction modification system DNA specificity domain-containing protein [Desulfocurvibacter africanus subsp. africanus str. Walvis Bay]
MQSDWKIRCVDDVRRSSSDGLATGPFGSSVSAKFFQSTGIPLIRGSNLSEAVGQRLVEDEYVFMPEEKAAEFPRAIAIRGDLVFTCWGTIGQVGLIDKRARFDRYLVSNKQMKLSPDPAKADSLFLYYLFSSPQIRATIKNLGIGSSVPGFNLGQLRSIRFPLPPLSEQSRISRVLGALDDKIEQNQQAVRALERLAQAIFCAWFVDFEPIKAKVAGATSFPSMPQPVFDALSIRLIDSKIGPVPEGWKVGTVSDLATLSKTQIKPQDYPDELFDYFSIPAFDTGKRAFLELGKAIKSNKFVVVEGCVLLSKLNPRIPRIWLPPPPNGKRQITSTEFLVFVPCSSIDRHYLYCQFQQSSFRENLAQGASGTSSSHQRVRPNDLLGKAVIVPPKPIRMEFAHLIDPLFSFASACLLESTKLAEMRDYLLPKLLSGEVTMRDMR